MQVEGFMRETYFIGMLTYFMWYNLCLTYGGLVALVQAIKAGDWYTEYHMSVAFCETYANNYI